MIAGNPAPTVISFLRPAGAADAPTTSATACCRPTSTASILPPAGSPNYFVGSMDDGGQYGAPQDALTLWKFHADFTTPANSTFTLDATRSRSRPSTPHSPARRGSRDCIPQPGTSNKIDILSYRQRPMHRLAYRNFGDHESLVTNQSVEAAPSIAGIRWYEIRDPERHAGRSTRRGPTPRA